MRALVADPAAPHRLSLQEVPEPVPNSDEAVVDVHAISLNRGEIRGLPGRTAGSIPGWDLAGVVWQAAATGGPPAGTRVVGLVRSGAWAEQVAVPITRLAELPESMSFDVASTLPIAGLTALRALELAGPLFGRRVLVTGAAGAVGHFAVQLAKLAGANVTGLTRSPERAAFVQQLGADEVVAKVDPEGETFDVVIESVGGAILSNALRRVAHGGTVVSFGATSGEPTTFDASSVAFGARLCRMSVFDEIEKHQSGTRDLRLLVDQVAAKRLEVQISLTAAWDDPAAALNAVVEGRITGKAVLVVRGTEEVGR